MTEENKEKSGKLKKSDIRLMEYFCAVFLCLFIGFIFIPYIINLFNPSYGWNLYDFIVILVISLLWTVPALTTNATMVIFGKNGKPIDGGRLFKGKRILGEGKTWQGMIGGVLFGLNIGMIIWVLNYFVINDAMVLLGLNNFQINPVNGDVITIYKNEAEIASFFKIPPLTAFLTSFCTAFGAFFGDMVGSAIKRRLNYKRGAPLPLIDQLDFISFAMLFAYLCHPIQNVWLYVVFMLIFTPLVHLLANVIAYMLHLKKEPW
ncbi:MAG: CDP-2,3-bis-(O-geranylgeranyl)-sn-glycerol synthase [Candidatus Helarchaeota archaeon]